MIQRVVDILDRLQVQYAVIGGMALAARGYARMTLDFDLFTTDVKVLQPEVWATLLQSNIPVEVRRGHFDDPLRGVTRIGSVPHEVDVVVGKWKWEQRIIDRAELLAVPPIAAPVRVPTTSDLIVLKLVAGGGQDRSDVHALLEVGPRDRLIAAVSRELADLPETIQKEARSIWDAIIAEQ